MSKYVEELKDLVTLALPYIEEAAGDPGYKSDNIDKLLHRFRDAIMSDDTEFGKSYDGRIKTYPMIEMGHGRVGVMVSKIDELNAVVWHTLSNHIPLGESIPIPEGKTHMAPEEIEAAVTFANVEGLDVLIETLVELRATMTSQGEGAL